MNNLRNILVVALAVFLLFYGLVAYAAHSENYTEASPTDNTLATSIDDEIVKSRRMIRERIATDHKIASSDDGTAKWGVHKQVTFEQRISTPTEPTGAIATIYPKTGDYDAELRFSDTRDVDTKFIIVGEVKMILGTTVPGGWLPLDGSTIGDATSGADYAGDDYKDLFYWIYAECADTECAVSTGRGVDDDADWGAHKTLTMPDARARMPIGSGTDGVLTTRTIGDTGGDETKDYDTHTHADGTLATDSHTHSISGDLQDNTWGPGPNSPGSQTADTDHDHGGATGGKSADITGDTGNSTGLSAVDVMNPWIALTFIIKY